MSELGRYGFAYSRMNAPVPPSKYEDPAKAAFLNELTALRRQRPFPTTSQSHNNASARNGLSAGQSVPSAAPRISGDCREYVAPKTQFGTRKKRVENNPDRWKDRVLKAAIAAGEPIRPCKICGGPIPAMENGRKVRIDTETCSPNCRRLEYNRARRERLAQKRAAKAVAK